MPRSTILNRGTAIIRDWTTLIPSDFVIVERLGVPCASGWVDDVTEDGKIVWLYLAHGGGRRMFLKQDGCLITIDVLSSSA